MTRLVTVYRRRGVLILEPSCRTVASVWIGSLPIVKLDEECPNQVLGQTLLDLLEKSRTGVPHPAHPESKALLQPLLDAAGVKSYRAFAKGTTSCGVVQDQRQLKFELTRNERGKGTFFPLIDREFSIPADSSPKEIGAALREALELCEGE
jgi:hypothetical protein